MIPVTNSKKGSKCQHLDFETLPAHICEDIVGMATQDVERLRDGGEGPVVFVAYVVPIVAINLLKLFRHLGLAKKVVAIQDQGRQRQ